MAFVTPVVEHWLVQEIAQWVHPMKDRSDDPSHHEQTLLPRSYISLLLFLNNMLYPTDISLLLFLNNMLYPTDISLLLFLNNMLYPTDISLLLFLNNMLYPTDRTVHITAFLRPLNGKKKRLNRSTMRDRSNEPLHHEYLLYHISVPLPIRVIIHLKYIISYRVL